MFFLMPPTHGSFAYEDKIHANHDQSRQSDFGHKWYLTQQTPCESSDEIDTAQEFINKSMKRMVE